MSPRLVFILSSGRSGSRALSRLFAQIEGVSSHHEYVRDYTQRAIAEYYMGLRSRESIGEVLLSTYESAASYDDGDLFIDSNNKLCWVADLLPTLFPSALFVHLHRDGRKVTSSFFHKLKQAMYPLRETRLTNAYLLWRLFGDSTLLGAPPMKPPPTEQFWWTQPTTSREALVAFGSSTRYEQICYHWSQSNLEILNARSVAGEQRVHRVSLESLTSDNEAVFRLFQFIGLPYRDALAEILVRPDHVYVPFDFDLNDEQAAMFARECGSMMQALGYSLDDRPYRVAY